MGRDIAAAVPEAMAVYDEGSDASGMDLKELCFERPGRGPRRHRGAAAGARHDVPRDRRGAARARHRARRRRRPLGRRVLGARLGRRRCPRATRSRSCASAGSRWPRRRGSIPARWRRSSGSPTRPSRRSARRSRTCGRRTTTARASSSSRARRRRSTRRASRRSARARAARSSCASPARSTRRSSRARPSGCARRSSACTSRKAARRSCRPSPRSVEDAQRYRELLIEQLTAPVRFTQAARELIDHGVTTFVEVGPGNVLGGLLKRIDRSVRIVLGQRPEVARRGDRSAWLATVRLPRGQARARHRRLARDRPRDRGGARARRRARSSSATARARTRPRQLAAEIGGRAVQADVSSPEDAKRLVDEAGDIDVLVNNAGLTRDGLLARMSDDDWRTVIDTNLSSVFYTCRAVTRPMMKKRGGSIVNISSVVGVHGNWGQTNYAASKAGIIGFTKSLARELGSRDIRANVVAPGYVKTQLTEVLPEEATAAMIAGHAARPRRRAGGDRRRGTLPRLRRGLVHHGRGAARRRRTGDVMAGNGNGQRRVVITGLGHGQPARQRRARRRGRACSRASPARREITRVRPHRLQRPLRLRAEGLRPDRTGSTARRRAAWTASRR